MDREEIDRECRHSEQACHMQRTQSGSALRPKIQEAFLLLQLHHLCRAKLICNSKHVIVTSFYLFLRIFDFRVYTYILFVLFELGKLLFLDPSTNESLSTLNWNDRGTRVVEHLWNVCP